MEIVELTGATDGAGAATITADRPSQGMLEKIQFDFDDTAATLDLTITNESSISEPVMIIANVAAADAVWYPRSLANKQADGSAFTDVAEKLFVTGKFKVVAAQGGATKNIRVLFFVDDNM